MTGRKLIALIENGASIVVIGFVLIAFPFSSAYAEQSVQPPRKGCLAVDKREYQSAKRKGLLQTKFATYVRTGRFGRPNYWYCHVALLY